MKTIWKRGWRGPAAWALSVALANGGPASSAEPNGTQLATPPAAAVKPVTDTYFGTPITDPYRWMEQGAESPELAAFLRAQNEHTRAVMGRFARQREKLLARLTELDNAVAQVRQWKRAGNHTFYLQAAPGARSASLMVLTRGAPARTLLDPESFNEQGSHAAIDYFEPSPDGRRVAVGVSLGGSENSTLRVVETDSGKLLPDAITRTQYGFPSWLSDSKSFFYSRFPQLPPDAPATAIYENERAYLHTIGTDPERDRAVFGPGVAASLSVPVAGFVMIFSTPGSPHVLALHSAGTTDRPTLYVAAVDPRGSGAPSWRRVASRDDELATTDRPCVVHGDDLYVLSDKNAPNRKLLVLNLKTGADVSRARVLVPESDAALQDVWAASDAVYVVARKGMQFELLRVPYGSNGRARKISMPYEGSITQIHAHGLLPGVLFGHESWVRAPAALYYDPKADTVTDTGIIPKHPVDLSGMQAREVEIPSEDGTMVPLSIVSRRGVVLDGSHPTLYEGYGAYGISMDARFRPNLLAWIERGGVWAVVHARGGGEYGERWHEAGRKGTKQHTIDDMIAAARYLIGQKYTSPEHLAVRGTSAGGISMGGAITQHPELFAAAIDNVGATNMLRFHLTQSGAANVPEFGDINDPKDFRALYAMSAYHHVQDGVRYPAVMGMTGVNDPRVPSWIVAQMIARLQAASSSGRPVLLRVDFDAGHGLGSSRVQRLEQLADEWTFILSQTAGWTTPGGAGRAHTSKQLTAPRAPAPVRGRFE